MKTEKKLIKKNASINKTNEKARIMTFQFMDNRNSIIQQLRTIQDISSTTKANLPLQLKAWIAAKPLAAAGSSVSGDELSVSSDSTRGPNQITNNSANATPGVHPLSHHHIFITNANIVYNRGFGPAPGEKSILKGARGRLFTEQNDSQYGSKVEDIIPTGGINNPEAIEDNIVINAIASEFINNNTYKLFNHNCQHFAQDVKRNVLANV